MKITQYSAPAEVLSHEIFRAKYKHISINKEYTYCFEVIYPENKIVVNYEALEDLFLISITHTPSGKEINIHATSFKTVNKVDKTSIHAFLSGFEEVNMEGYVVKYTKGLTNSLRVKYKFNTYVEKHKGKSLSEATRGYQRLLETALQESATHSATLLPNCGTCGTLFEHHTFVAPMDLISVASIHERPIFRSLATNLGTTFEAPTNLGTQKGEDSQ